MSNFFENTIYSGFAENKDFLVITPNENKIDLWLKFVFNEFKGTNTLIILDDCAGSKDLKQRSNELVKLAFSARHSGISVWVLTQQLTSIAKIIQRKCCCSDFVFHAIRKRNEGRF